MADKMYFSDGNKVYTARFLDENYPENPRDENYMTNLGTMVFPKNNNSRHTFGDVQPESFDDFFKEELSKAEPHEYIEGSIEFTLPTLEDCQKNESLSRFIAGTEESGYHFDVDLFNQEMDSILSSVKDNQGASICEDLTGGIPIDENTGKLTDSYIIDLRTANCNDYYGAESAYNQIRDELAYHLSGIVPKNFFNYQGSIHHFNELDNLTESQLYDKWAATKLCVIPIDLYEHSGLTCHEASVRKTLHVTNDRDDGAIYNDGFIFIDKDNREVLDQLKGEARDSEGKVYNTWKPKSLDEVKEWAETNLRNEIETYASYLEGDVHEFQIEEFNPETLSWDILENETESFIFGSGLKETVENHGFQIKENLNIEQIEKLEKTITPEFKNAVWENFKKEVREALPEFEGNIGHAAGAVLYSMNKLNSNSLQVQALREYMTENGCTTKEKTDRFLKEAVPVVQKEFDPFLDEGKQFEIYFSTNHNPEASNYLSKMTPEHALVVDPANKRYGLLSGSYSFNGSRFEDYKKIPDLSTKKLREKIEQLEAGGFHFEKFTTKDGIYSQGNPEKLYPKSRQKEKDAGLGR